MDRPFVCPEELKCVKPVREGSYEVELNDGERHRIPFDMLPDSINSSSPEQLCDSDRKCMICSHNMKEVFVYVWPTSWKDGRLIEFDRKRFTERKEGYVCLECGKYRTFKWELNVPESIMVTYYSPGEWHVRYQRIMSPVTAFAINDRSGIALATFINGEYCFSFCSAKLSPKTDVKAIILDDIVKNPGAIEWIYGILGDKKARQINGAYYCAPKKARRK